MTPLDRLIIFLSSVLLVLIALALSISAVGWNPTDVVLGAAGFVQSHRIESGLAGLLLLLAGWHLVFLAVAPTGEQSIVRETSLGQVSIQHRALENLVIRSAQEVNGIRDVEARIAPQGEGIEIAISMNVLPEFRIPELSDQVQEVVERVVRDVAGVMVTRVSVEVRNVAGYQRAAKATKARVE